MKSLVKSFLFITFIGFSYSLFAQNTAQNTAPSVPTTDSIKTEIIETDSTVLIKSVQVTSVEVNSARINQELERFRYEEAQLEQKLKQVRAQIKEFERLLGGVLVTEKRIADKKEAAARKVKEKEEADKKEKDKETIVTPKN